MRRTSRLAPLRAKTDDVSCLSPHYQPVCAPTDILGVEAAGVSFPNDDAELEILVRLEPQYPPAGWHLADKRRNGMRANYGLE
jgi:hypothetical protein